jgi:uncharacterized protein YcaQ
VALDRLDEQLLDFMTQRGEVAIAGRRGHERLWDLADRVYPDHPIVPVAEARRLRDQRRAIDRPTVGLSKLVPIVGLFGHRTAAPTYEGEDHD